MSTFCFWQLSDSDDDDDDYLPLKTERWKEYSKCSLNWRSEKFLSQVWNHTFKTANASEGDGGVMCTAFLLSTEEAGI